MNLSLVALDKKRANAHRAYKMCICLQPTDGSNDKSSKQSAENNKKVVAAAAAAAAKSTKRGRLFAVKSDLKCENFSKSFCQASAPARVGSNE